MAKEEKGEKEQVSRKALLFRIITVSIKMPLLLLLLLIMLTFVGTSAFLSRYPNVLSFAGITLNPQLMAQQRNERILSEVGTLMNLPVDEQPTMATVTDVDQVKDQAFFKDARNGDMVLIYPNDRKAILYRPDEKRIIEVGALNINQQNQPEVAGDDIQENEVETEEEEAPTPTEEPTETPTPEPTETTVEEEDSE